MSRLQSYSGSTPGRLARWMSEAQRWRRGRFRRALSAFRRFEGRWCCRDRRQQEALRQIGVSMHLRGHKTPASHEQAGDLENGRRSQFRRCVHDDARLPSGSERQVAAKLASAERVRRMPVFLLRYANTARDDGQTSHAAGRYAAYRFSMGLGAKMRRFYHWLLGLPRCGGEPGRHQFLLEFPDESSCTAKPSSRCSGGL